MLSTDADRINSLYQKIKLQKNLYIFEKKELK